MGEGSFGQAGGWTLLPCCCCPPVLPVPLPMLPAPTREPLAAALPKPDASPGPPRTSNNNPGACWALLLLDAGSGAGALDTKGDTPSTAAACAAEQSPTVCRPAALPLRAHRPARGQQEINPGLG